MPYYFLKCYLLLKLASHPIRTRTIMEISSTPNVFVLSLALKLGVTPFSLYNMYLYC